MAGISETDMSRDSVFADRCDFIALKYAANYVIDEDTATPNHVNRLALGQRMLRRGMPQGLWALLVLAKNPTVAATAIGDTANHGALVADADIDAAIQTVWNDTANAMAGQP